MIYVSQLKEPPEFYDFFIDFFNDNLLYSQLWNETRLIRIKDGISKDIHKSGYLRITDLATRVKNFVKHDSKFDTIQNIEIVKYPQGASMSWHYDMSRETTTGASITYLNDNYIGGHTIIEGVDVTPLQGRTVYFDGQEFKHSVSNVIKGSRYTLSVWYGYDPQGCLKDGY